MSILLKIWYFGVEGEGGLEEGFGDENADEAENDNEDYECDKDEELDYESNESSEGDDVEESGNEYEEEDRDCDAEVLIVDSNSAQFGGA